MLLHICAYAATQPRCVSPDVRSLQSLLADQDGCGVHMAWDPGPRILTLIFRTTVTDLLVLAQHSVHLFHL